MKRNILVSGLFFLLTSSSLVASPKDISLRFELTGCKYDSLAAVLFYGPNPEGKDLEYRVKGASKDGSDWTFSVPDSIYRMTSNLRLRDFMSGGFIRFATDGHSGSLPFVTDESVGMHVKASFVSRDEVKSGTMINDKFRIDNPTPEFIAAEIVPASFCSFTDPNNPQKSKEELLQEYLNSIKEHPLSRALVRKVYLSLAKFPNQESLQRVYNAFSKEAQATYYGAMIGKSVPFFKAFQIDVKLTNCKTRQQELVLSDFSKPNLLLFSASWCGPCHAAIPLMKQIYKDLGADINMTYISLDEPDSRPQWYELMEKEQIPWRSMAVEGNLTVRQIRDNYSVTGIPNMTLVLPDKSRKVIDLRNEADKEWLYKLLGK